MKESRFDRLLRSAVDSTSRRGFLATLTSLILAGAPTAPAPAARRRSRHRLRPSALRHRRDRAQQQHRRDRHDAHADACIPTGQRCPGKKVRGKKRKNLGCNKCCQGSFTIDATGKKVCGCQPNGGACNTATATSCCSGYCDGSICQIPPSAPCSTRTCAGCCDRAGACQAGTGPTACGSSGAACAVCAGSTAVCANHVCGACASHTECGTDSLCVDGACHACDVVNGQDLAAAVAAASDGDTLYICAGTYAGGLTINKTLTLIGAGQDTNGTVIQGGSPGLNIVAGREAKPVGLRDLRIQDGTGPGVHLHSTWHLTITDCTLNGNDATVGGGIFNQGGTLLMTRCTVEDNSVNNQGGGLFNNNGQTTLIDCRIWNNYASSYGGGISTVGGALTLRGTRVSGNFAGTGSGIANLSPAIPVTFEASSVVCANNPTIDQCAGFTVPSSACQDTCPPA